MYPGSGVIIIGNYESDGLNKLYLARNKRLLIWGGYPCHTGEGFLQGLEKAFSRVWCTNKGY